jgi:hypothetical protein
MAATNACRGRRRPGPGHRPAVRASCACRRTPVGCIFRWRRLLADEQDTWAGLRYVARSTGPSRRRPAHTRGARAFETGHHTQKAATLSDGPAELDQDGRPFASDCLRRQMDFRSIAGYPDFRTTCQRRRAGRGAGGGRHAPFPGIAVARPSVLLVNVMKEECFRECEVGRPSALTSLGQARSDCSRAASHPSRRYRPQFTVCDQPGWMLLASEPLSYSSC